MGMFDFFRRKEPDVGPQNSELLAALKAEKVTPSPVNRAHLLSVLKRSIVLIAVRDLPPHLRDVEGPGTFGQETHLDLLSSTNAQGERVGLIFSDHRNVQARKKDAPWISMPAQQAAKWWLDAQGFVINPAGDWVMLSPEEVAQLANGDFE